MTLPSDRPHTLTIHLSEETLTQLIHQSIKAKVPSIALYASILLELACTFNETEERG